MAYSRKADTLWPHEADLTKQLNSSRPKKRLPLWIAKAVIVLHTTYPNRQDTVWTNAGILLIGPLETNFWEILIQIHIFSFKKIHLKMAAGKCFAWMC